MTPGPFGFAGPELSNIGNEQPRNLSRNKHSAVADLKVSKAKR